MPLLRHACDLHGGDRTGVRPLSTDTAQWGYPETWVLEYGYSFVFIEAQRTPGILEYPSTIHRRVIFLKNPDPVWTVHL